VLFENSMASYVLYRPHIMSGMNQDGFISKITDYRLITGFNSELGFSSLRPHPGCFWILPNFLFRSFLGFSP
jgi:hypothetical protein